MASESGYSNQKKLGTSQFKTIHNVGSDKYGQSVASKALYEKTAVAAITVTEIVGTSGQVEFLNVQYAAHLALPNDVIRITSGNFLNSEFDIISVIDPTNFRILPILKASDITGANAIIMSWVTNKANSDGSQIVALAPAPIQFVKDTLPVNVSKDTAVPANSVPLPTENLIAQASLSSIDGKFTTLNATDFATSAKQDTGNSSLSSIDGKSQANGVVDAGNSSVTPLGINGVFTGAAFEITRYAAINVNVRSDVASATNGLKVEFSPDGTNWDHSHQTTYSGGSGVGYIFNAEFKFARVVYTNSTVAQTSFRLQTIFKTTLTTSSLYTLSQTVNANMFAALNRSIISGETTGGGGGYVNVKVNPSGALTVEADVTGTVSVSNFPATQPVSGSVSVSNFPATQPVSAASLPLPTGASTLAEQQAQSTYLSSIDSNSGTIALPVHTETSAFTTASSVVSGIDPSTSTVRALRVNSNNQLLTFIGNTSVVIQQSTQAGVITQTQKSVGLTAVRATVSGSAPLSSRKKVMFKPSKNNTGSIYIGASSVTISNGMEIIGPDRLEFSFDSSDYYLISDVAGQVVEIVEIA